MSDQVRREVVGTKKLTDEERAWLAEHGHKLIAGERMTREYDDLEKEDEDGVLNVGATPYYGPETKFYGEDA